MIDLYKEEGKYWLQKSGQKWIGTLNCTKKQLERLYNDIGKILGKVDWKKEMEDDKRKFLLGDGLKVVVRKGKHVIVKAHQKD